MEGVPKKEIQANFQLPIGGNECDEEINIQQILLLLRNNNNNFMWLGNEEKSCVNKYKQ